VGLVASAFLIRALAARQPRADYRLLVASGYLGMGTTWHAGPSGTVPLLFAGSDSFMLRDGLLAAPVPLSATIFTAGNVAFVVVVVAALTLLAVALQPKDGSEPRALDGAPPPAVPEPPETELLRGFAARVSVSRAPTAFLGGLGALYVLLETFAGRFSLSLDGVNLIVISLALLAFRSPRALLAAAEQAARPLHGVVLQFPLYAGIYGLIQGTGLAEKLAQAFLAVATAETLPVVVFAYSAVVDYWVPSGGAKWAMEAPYLLKAGAALGVGPESVAVAYAYGDMATNLIQPFWAIPLLGVAKLEFKDILGYELLFFAAFTAIAVVALV
jgi:short-chain fatty acids transporter